MIQNVVWQRAMERNDFRPDMAAFRSAPPCFSEHATGKTVDFSLLSVEGKISESPTYRWLLENAPKYGWGQSFREGGRDTTRNPRHNGIAVEAWHWRHKSLRVGPTLAELLR